MRRSRLPFVILCLAVLPAVGAADEPLPHYVHGTVVDQEGNPVAGAVVRVIVSRDFGGVDDSRAVTADASGTYRFPEPFNKPGQYLILRAANADGTKLGWLVAGRIEKSKSETPFQIVVRPAREVTVQVTDAAGAPVNEATVGLLVGMFVGPSGETVSQGRTGTDGIVRLRYPVDAKVGSVFALKSGKGLDNWAALIDGYPSDQPEIPQELFLQLDGAMTVRVRVVDDAGEPVAGTEVSLQQFSRSTPGANGRRPQMNGFWSCREVSVPTNEQGFAAFDWLPADFKGLLEFDIRSQTHFTLKSLSLIRDADPIDRAPAQLAAVRFTKISGAVIGADGRPAAGIGVESLRGHRQGVLKGHIASTRTGADGTYELDACPQFAYAVSVVDRDWAASPVGVIVGDAQPVGGVDFSLAKGTLVRGTITTGKNRRPAANLNVNLNKNGNLFPQKLPKPGERDDPADDPSRLAARWTFTDAQGRYEFRVVSGSYTLFVVDNPQTRSQKTAELDVADEPEIIRDFHVQGAQLETLSGVVVGPDDKPVDSPVIRALYAAFVRPFPNRETKVTADAAGKFHMERQPVPVWLFVSSSDGTLASRVQAEADQDSITVKLAPAATVVGRLIDDDIPVVGAEIMFRQLLSSPGPGGRSQVRFFAAGTASTRADGRFAMPGLIVGERYEVGAAFRGEAGRIRLDPPAVDRPGSIDLGYLDVPKWRMEVTAEGRGEQRVDIAARAAGRFNVNAALADRMSVASADAKREYRRVMLVLGDPESPATQALFKIVDRIEIAPDLSRTLLDFQPVYVTIKDQDAIAYATKSYRLDAPKPGSAVIVILGDDGAVAEQQEFHVDGEPPKLDAGALHDFLKRHALPLHDAAQLLKAAMRRAHDEKKRILLQLSGPSLYPCRLLARFIDRHRELLERDYLYVHIDAVRSSRADAVLEGLRKTGNAVPWMAIINADGVKLVDSDSPTGNIGFPSEPDGINYFIDEMMKPTAQRLTPKELEELRTALGGGNSRD